VPDARAFLEASVGLRGIEKAGTDLRSRSPKPRVPAKRPLW